MNFDCARLDSWLEEGDYASVIKTLASKSDENERLAWLRSKSGRLHAHLLFEQGIAEFSDKPTIETIIKVTLPLFKMAVFRLMQDGACRKVTHLSLDSLKLNALYRDVLNVKVRTSLNFDLNILENKLYRKEVAESLKATVLETAAKSKCIPLPSPAWIITKDELQTEELFKELRDNFADKVIMQLTLHG